ncbi:hypothetical protein Golob_016218 [Gossypium lobatum]|uniref:Uncharacterized protein n=1 Tax=Gossypium lobatum TaxID=34289 RepID=A0A7J8M3M2_9ROSI|nr:hypothetical protein [Gossypium lobatum]
MAESANHCQSSDPTTGFCSQTRTFHSLRPEVPLPPPYQPLSLPQYTLSLLRSSTATTGCGDTTFVINATKGDSLSYSEFIAQNRYFSCQPTQFRLGDSSPGSTL